MKFRKKPIVIEAVQWTGGNPIDIENFIGANIMLGYDDIPIWNSAEKQHINCPKGHWVIRGIAGEFYPCDPSIFEQTYEAVPE